MRKLIKIIIAIVLVITVLFISYLEVGHYSPSPSALKYVATAETEEYITFDNQSTVGFIFYPGAKVDAMAYSYLSEIGSNVYIAKFPFELAMFDSDIASEIIAENPDVTTWYIGGHSLGGVFANRYATKNPDMIDGLVFLGSYPAEGDENKIPAIALFADQDLLVGDYTSKTMLFSPTTNIIELDNANHSGFGDYGQQKGDSVLSTKETDVQRETIIEEISTFIEKN